MNNLRQIGQALMVYVQDWNEKIPPRNDAREPELLSDYLYPYYINNIDTFYTSARPRVGPPGGGQDTGYWGRYFYSNIQNTDLAKYGYTLGNIPSEKLNGKETYLWARERWRVHTARDALNTVMAKHFLFFDGHVEEYSQEWLFSTGGGWWTE